ncbi:Alpha/Beta hydrolase protein [Infundibulicybe gibba]|nr:Alpha/Beta hydrolase protein [Infundibulicybe gibba]
MSTKTAPFGTWESPITAESITKGSIRLADVIVDAATSTVYHIESRPSEAGRDVLVHTASGRDIVGPGWNVRTGVQEYGGAAAVHAGTAYFSHYKDGRLYAVNAGGGEPQAVTPESAVFRFADFEVHPMYHDLLVSVLEDHTDDTPAAVVTTLCIINTRTKSVHPLVAGADFYAAPRFSSDGSRIAWQQWFHPDMPWEGPRSIVSLANATCIAGKRGVLSCGYPSWASTGTLLFTSDVSGYQNPWKYSNGTAAPLFSAPIPEDFAEPAWLLGWSPFAMVDPEGRYGIFSAIRDGRNVAYLVDTQSQGAPQLLDTPYVEIRSVRCVSRAHAQAVFIGARADDKASIIQCKFVGSSGIAHARAEFSVLHATPTSVNFGPEIISPPRPISLKIPPSGAPLHVVYYAPRNPAYAGSSIKDERPPCVVSVHGGPTGFTSQGLSWEKQYFTSRGWGWLDVNYGGSSGYGRAYIERLIGKWGIVDVEDCINAAQALSSPAHALADPSRIVIRGTSSGGFTVLAALSIAPDVTVFAAGTSSYGVSDLRKLVEFTYKFESRYLDKLIGGTPTEVPEVYKARSPVFHADKITSPLLVNIYALRSQLKLTGMC